MPLISNTEFALGPYVVLPATHPTDSGRFSASFSVRHVTDEGRNAQVFMLDATFASCHAARLFAVTQGWLKTCGPYALGT